MVWATSIWVSGSGFIKKVVMNKLFFVIVAFALFWSACSKDPSTDGGSETPVFFLHLDEIDGDTAGLIAGKNGIYLFTDIKKDSMNVLEMSGRFADVACPDGSCGNSVKFRFKNNNLENFVTFDGLFNTNPVWDYAIRYTGFNYRTVTVEWNKPDGTFLSTEVFEQPQDSSLYYFHVTDPVTYDANEKGQPTFKMYVDFSCILWNPNTFEGHIVRGNGVIGVAYQ